MIGNLKIVGGKSHPLFVNAICDHLSIKQTETETLQFSNENLLVKINEIVRESDVFVIQTSCPPVHENLFETLMLIDALRNATAARVVAVLPYFPYVRSDKKDQPRICMTAKLVADLLKNAGASHVLTMDLHSPQIQAFFNIPADQINATKIICEYFRRRELNNYVVVSGDVGSAKMVGTYAKTLNLPFAIIDKRRIGNEEKVEPVNIIGDVEGKDCLIIDDEVASGGTLCSAANFLKENGAKSVRAAIVHPVLSGKAYERIEDSCLEELVVTDSIPIEKNIGKRKKIKVLSVAELFANAISVIHNGGSISKLII